MTISSTVRIAGPYIGSGAATVFPFAFKVFAAAEMQVAKLNTTSNVETILVLNTDYTVQLNGDQNGTPGGTITLPAVLASGFNLTITSDIANLQPTDLTNQGGFYPEVITDALDRATIQIQQLDQNSRAIKIPLSDGVLDMTTPVVSARQGKYLAFDSLGLPVVSAGTGNDSALRTDLANATAVSAGSRLSGFRQAGTGATARTVDAKLKDTVSVKDFGAVGDGVTNDAAAINAAITAAIANGGGTVYFPVGAYKCSTRIGTFVNANNITLFGYGAEIQNFAGINSTGLLQFGNATLDGNGMYSAYTTTVTNLSILGIKFTSSNVFNVTNPGRWSDQMPISINTAKNVVIRDCLFINQDFASVDFGAVCKNCIVDSCYFYSSQIDAGSANYGVRIFCYGATTNYQNGNGDLSPTDSTTGILKVGYALISDSSLTWGHENINVVNCQFEQMSHGVMTSAARRGVISGNSFKNMTTRSISLTTYSQEYSCFGNIHYYDTTQQTSLSVSVFYSFGQATYKHKISGDKFTVIGAMPVGSGFSPIKCYINSHDWEISNCTFDMPTFAGGGGFGSISVEDNSDGRIQNNYFNTPAAANCILLTPALAVASPGYQSKTIEISGNTFFAYTIGAVLIWDTTSTPDAIIIKNNIVSDLANTRFIATNFSNAAKVAKLFLENNSIMSTTMAYYVFNSTANQAVLLNSDILEFKTNLTTGGVANPSTTSVTFDFSAFRLPPCYSSGTKIYDYTIYGNRENAQASTNFYFEITSVTATTIVGNIVRNAGASFQSAALAMTVRFLPYIV